MDCKANKRKLAYGLVLFNLVALSITAFIFLSGRDPSVLGADEQTFTMPGTGDYHANFNDAGYDDWGGTTQVSEIEVRLGLVEGWWDEDYNYYRQLTIKNLSAEELAAGSTAQVMVNTKELYDDGKLKDNCQDLRVLWKDPLDDSLTELSRSFYGYNGGSCSASRSTTISFPLKSAIAASGSDSNYFVYYGNSSASSPGYGDSGYSNPVSGANATLICPFNGTTTCVNGETPTTESGAIRYSGNKSGLSFDGVNDKVLPPGIALGSDFTVETFFKVYNKGGFGGVFGGDMNKFYLDIRSDRISYWDGVYHNYFATIDTGWHHIAITRSADNNVNVFFDGSVVSSQAGGTVLNTITQIGTFWGASSYTFLGSLDEFRASNIVRYTENFTPQTTPFTPDENTMLLLHFDENGDDPRQAGKALDSSGNGNHGTINGAKYVSGLVGVDSSTAQTGALPTQSYAGHTGVFIEEGTTNKVTNPSFDHATYNTNWGYPYTNYDSTTDTFTPAMAKRNTAGPFAQGIVVQGSANATGTTDTLSYTAGSVVAYNTGHIPTFSSNIDSSQGSIVFWVTPEWNGNNGLKHILFSGYQNIFCIWKGTDSYLYFDMGWSQYVRVDVSGWTAGTTYNVVARWDRKNMLEGSNYLALSVNGVHTFGCPTLTATEYNGIPIYIGSYWNATYPANAVIEGFTVYRRPLYESTATSGINVGNGDEISQIYNGSIANSKDPTLITGSWDVMFALPTNATTGSLATPTATGEAWTHPHLSNVLYTSTANTGGFMMYGANMGGNYTSDGWTDHGAPGTVSNLSDSEKVYKGGYKWTNDATNEGIKYTKTGLTAGQNYVVRALAHSDATSIPKIQIWDVTNGAEITQMTGTNASTRIAPNVFLFTFELPTVARNGVAADCTSIEVRLLNTETSGTVHWHQVELLNNLVDNPSLEGTYSGTPTLPAGWSNSGLEDGEILKEEGVALIHSGTASTKIMNDLEMEGFTQTQTSTVGAYYGTGSWGLEEAGSGGVFFEPNFVSQYSGATSSMNYQINGSSWTHYPKVGRLKLTQVYVRPTSYYGSSTTSYFDDIYVFQLTDVSLTVTSASEANSLETTGLRVDGLDTLSQPLTGISASSGNVRFRVTPRHSWSTATAFGIANPVIAVLYGNSENYIKVKYLDATTLRVESFFDNNSVNANWANPVLDAGTSYGFEISYTSGGNLVLKVNNVEVATSAGVVDFGTTPDIIYFGSDDNGENQYDSTINYYGNAPSENATAPYYKFGSKSVKLNNTGPAGDEYVISINAGNTNNHTLSAYVYNGTSGAVGGTVDTTVAKLVFNGVAQTTTYTDMGGGWWRLTYTGEAGSGVQNYGVQVMGTKIVYVDGVQLEEKAYATTYADGTLGTGYAWSGTAHESTSERTGVDLRMNPENNIDPDEGTISLWIKPDWNSSEVTGSSARKYILMSNISSGSVLYLYYHEAGRWAFFPFTSVSSVSLSTSVTKNNWQHIVCKWNGSSASIFVNNNENTADYVDTVFVPSVIHIGKNASGTPHLNSTVSDFRIYDKALSAGEVADLYYQGLVTHQNSDDDPGKYLSTGTYTTPVLDLGPNSAWSAGDDFVTSELLNDGNITYQTSTSQDSIDWEAWQDLSGPEIQSTPRRYIKVKATLAPPEDQTKTPYLTGLAINYIPDANPPTNPTTLVTSPGDPEDWYNDSAPSFSWPRAEQEGGASDPGEGASGVSHYHVYFGTDNTAIPYHTVTNKWIIDDPEEGDVEFALPTELTEKGTYYLRVQAEDKAGNYPGNNPENTWEAFTYKFEAVNPTRPLYVGVSPSGYTRVNEYTFTWPAGTDDDSGVWGYCYQAGDGEETCESKEDLLVGENYQKELIDIAYKNGANIFYVRTKDNAGNHSSHTQATFYFNSEAPSAPLNVTAHQATGCSGGDDNCWYFSWNEPLEYTEEVVKYYYSINETPTAESPYVSGTNKQTETFAAGTRQGENSFYVVAEDVVGVSFGDYGTATFNVNTTAPGIPTNLLITDSSNRDRDDWALTIKWLTPSATGSGIHHYNVYRSENGTDFTKIAQTTATGYLDTGLTNTKTYHYKATAEDNAGAESGMSAGVSAVPTGKYTSPPLFGGTPTANTTAHTAVIQWTTERFTEGFVEYGRTTSYELGRIGGTGLSTAHRITIRGLPSETQFHYRVQSLDDGAVRNYDPATAYSEDYTFATMEAPDITDVRISDIALSSATISWETTTISTSEVHYGTTMSYGNVVSERSSSLTTNHTLRLSGLNSGTTYQFKIIGMDADDVEISSDNYTFSTIAYPRIFNVTMEKGEVEGEYGMFVSWESNVPATSIVRYYPAEDIGKARDETEADLKTSHTLFISGLLDNTRYMLSAQGRDAYGNLATSETQQFMTDIDTRPPILTKLVVETASQGTGKDAKAQIIVSWETNEPATSQVEYGRGVGMEAYSSKSAMNTSFGKTHVIVLSDLDSGTPYSVRVLSADAAGNLAMSGNYTVVTSMPTESALDLILSTLRANFGWLFDF